MLEKNVCLMAAVKNISSSVPFDKKMIMHRSIEMQHTDMTDRIWLKTQCDTV